MKYKVQKETRSEDGDKIYLCYFISESKNAQGHKRYGAGIDMYTQTAHRRTDRQRKIADGVFKTKVEAIEFLDTLARGTVTPTTLFDIVEDLLPIGEKFEKIELKVKKCRKKLAIMKE